VTPSWWERPWMFGVIFAGLVVLKALTF